MEEIEHRTTKIRSPRTNGFVERMNRTLLDECFRVTGRTTWYLEPEEIQRDLDRFLAHYNLERSHQGYRLKGRTPGAGAARGAGDRGTAAVRTRRGGGYRASSVEVRGGPGVGEMPDLNKQQ
jgi:transposase InsO family protein